MLIFAYLQGGVVPNLGNLAHIIIARSLMLGLIGVIAVLGLVGIE